MLATQNTKAPLTNDGQSLDIPIGRVTICLVRKTADNYRVVVLEHGGRAADGYTREFFTHLTPADITVEEDARRYCRTLYRDFRDSAETPQQVSARVRRDRAACACDPTGDCVQCELDREAANWADRPDAHFISGPVTPRGFGRR